jgi:hypothetical protein
VRASSRASTWHTNDGDGLEKDGALQLAGRLRELDEIRLIDIYCAQDAERVAGTGQCAGRRHRLRRDRVAGWFFAVYPPVSHLISENIRG